MPELPSLFDILGPIMIGPSSSHTAGASRIGLIARQLLRERPARAAITLYNSFAKTHKGHGTDKAIIGGILGFRPDDLRIRDAFGLGKQAGLEWTFSFVSDPAHYHSNTARIRLAGNSGTGIEIVGVSLGGGRIRIKELEGFAVDFNAQVHTLVIIADDIPGSIRNISGAIADEGANIAHMYVSRTAKRASMVIELDHALSDAAVQKIQSLSWIHFSRLLTPLEGDSSMYDK